MYHRFKFELDPTSIKHFSRPRKVQAQYSAYIVNHFGEKQCHFQALESSHFFRGRLPDSPQSPRL